MKCSFMHLEVPEIASERGASLLSSAVFMQLLDCLLTRLSSAKHALTYNIAIKVGRESNDIQDAELFVGPENTLELLFFSTSAP